MVEMMLKWMIVRSEGSHSWTEQGMEVVGGTSQMDFQIEQEMNGLQGQQKLEKYPRKCRRGG